MALERWGARRFFAEQAAVDAALEANTEWVQLHPGFGYEEFIRGLRLDGDSTVYVPGLLPRLADRVRSQDPREDLPVVLVLDEINRTDLSRMFGEAFSLLENRDRPARLPGINVGDEAVELELPEDLYVIGTMNLIDQSVEQLDFALRRRFFWRPCHFERGPIIAVNRERWSRHAPSRYGWDRAGKDIERLAEHAEELNRQIGLSSQLGTQYALGHTYYFDAAYFAGRWLHGRKYLSAGVLWDGRGRPRPPLDDLWTLSLEPVLAQYLEGVDTDTAREELARLRQVLLRGQVE